MTLRRTAAALLAQALLAATVTAQTPGPIQYPKTRKVDHVEVLHGTKVEDPYRWLEDDRSAETAAWVAEQNRVTFGYLERIPFRKQIRARLEQIYDFPKYSTPKKKRDLYLFRKNAGLQNQSVLYVQRGCDTAPEVLIDPNQLSADGTTKLVTFVPSRDARLLAYTLSTGGSDWQEIRVMDLSTRKELADRVEWVKVSGVAWHGDGFYYSRYEAPRGASALAAKNENHKVYFHKIGTPQSADRLVFEDPDPSRALRFHTLATSADERFAFLYISDRSVAGKDGNALLVRDLSKPDAPFAPLTDTAFESNHYAIGHTGGKILLMTNRSAPNWRLVLVDPAAPDPKNWKDVISEAEEPLEGVHHVGGKLLAVTMKDVSNRVRVYDLTGRFERDVPLPALGAVFGFSGEPDDPEVFFTFSSYTYPPTIYRYDVRSGESSVFRKPEVKFEPAAYETRQVFYSSKDGTRVPMFVVHRKGLELNGANPTLLYAYGGFNVAMTPAFNPLNVAWLEQGGVYAVANLRGGSEYGERWHKAGMLLEKQNVFDDFIAAAEWLKANKYTSTERLAIQGHSNGGLLVGAVINQRPDLAKVAFPAVGVMDMLRYHKFTIGFNWAAEYGSPDDPIHFANLLKYSPIHNIRSDTAYPATLVTTADHDDRVVPAHSFKYAATLQEKHSGPNPVLIRIDTKSGHGSSNTAKMLDEYADVFAFAFFNMGVTPRY